MIDVNPLPEFAVAVEQARMDTPTPNSKPSAATSAIRTSSPGLREAFFSLPAGAVLPQCYAEALKDLLRAQSFWPKKPRVERFTPAHWMWGQTVSHLVAVMQGFGWDLKSGSVVDDVCGPSWEYPLMVFARR